MNFSASEVGKTEKLWTTATDKFLKIVLENQLVSYTTKRHQQWSSVTSLGLEIIKFWL